MDSYDKGFNKMQEEAIRRVMEMQQRSREAVDGKPPHETEPKNAAPPKNDILGMLGGIKIDEEKALIALLIYILYKQGADIKLLIGLAYLLI